MPYHDWITSDKEATTSCCFYQEGIGIPRYYPPWLSSERSEGFYTSSGERRIGSNRNTTTIQRLRSIIKPRIQISKKIIGFRQVWFVTKKKIYLRNGRFKIVRKTTMKQVPIKLRFAKVTALSSAQILSSRFQPLFPNDLSYRSIQTALVPSTVRVDQITDISFGAGVAFQGGTMNCTGPGEHTTGIPLMSGVTLGTRSRITNSDPVPIDEELEIQSLRKLYNKVGSATPSFLTAVGESPELIRTLGDIGAEGVKLVWAIYRLNFKYIGKKISSLNIKKLSELWLTWVYGVAPVIGDIQSTLEVLSRTERLWRTYHASAIKETLSVNSDYPGNFYGLNRIEQKMQSKYGCILLGRLNLDQYIQDKVTDWSQVFSTGYELIPFSFMVDWLIDIGGYLSSVKVLSDQHYVAWHTRAFIYKDFWDGSLGPDRYNPYRIYSSARYIATQQKVIVERNFLSSLPDMPLPSLGSITNLIDVSTFKRSVNALAIAITRK
jgi:hypothetical protein